MSSRREFLQAGAWLALSLPMLEQAGREARAAFERQEPFRTLTAEEGRTLEAFAAQIIPTTDSPGAREAGAAHFIDRALGSFMKNELTDARAGLEDLNARSTRAHARRFADLTSAQQIEIMKQIERTPFFNRARDAVVMGTFADPKYGGNRNHIGYRILGVDHQPVYQPPFGYYDARAQ